MGTCSEDLRKRMWPYVLGELAETNAGLDFAPNKILEVWRLCAAGGRDFGVGSHWNDGIYHRLTID